MRYKKRGNGYYEVKVTVGHHIDGTPIRRSFYSKKSHLDARRKADDFMKRAYLTPIVSSSAIEGIPFDQWSREYIETYKKGTVRKSTYISTYQTPLEKHLIPFFKSRPLSTIQPSDIQAYFSQSTLGASTQKNYLILLHGIFAAAVDNGYCVKNPAEHIRIKATKKKEKRAYTLEQVVSVENYCFEHGYLEIVLMLETGVRRSELLGLQWTDYNQSEKLLQVDRGVTNYNGEGDTKSKSSRRQIPLSDIAAAALDALPRNGKYIFGGNTFTPISTFNSHYKKHMDDIARALDVPALTPHELRHTFGTVLREKGADIYTIQHALGHSDVTTTAAVYVHNNVDVLRRDMKLE